MAFGWFKKEDEQLLLQREFHRNCVEQIDDLERRINDDEIAKLQNAYSDVWVDNQATRELPEKVQLARRYATDLGTTLSTASTALESVWTALETLQGIIDHCEHGVQDLVAGLVTRQSLASIKKSDGA